MSSRRGPALTACVCAAGVILVGRAYWTIEKVPEHFGGDGVSARDSRLIVATTVGAVELLSAAAWLAKPGSGVARSTASGTAALALALSAVVFSPAFLPAAVGLGACAVGNSRASSHRTDSLEFGLGWTAEVAFGLLLACLLVVLAFLLVIGNL